MNVGYIYSITREEQAKLKCMMGSSSAYAPGASREGIPKEECSNFFATQNIQKFGELLIEAGMGMEDKSCP